MAKTQHEPWEEGFENERELFRLAHRALAMDNTDIAKLLRVNRKTISRWLHQGTSSGYSLGDLAPHVYPRDPELAKHLHAYAARVAARVRLPQPPPLPIPLPPEEPVAPPPPTPSAPGTPKLRADGVLCAASLAMDASPRAMRPALFAAVRYARQVGATLEELEKELAPPAGKKG